MEGQSESYTYGSSRTSGRHATDIDSLQIVTHLDGDGAGPDVQLPLYYRILEDIPWLGR